MRTAKTDQTLADAQADLSLRWAHSHFVGFVMSWLIFVSARTSETKYTKSDTYGIRDI